MAGPKADAFYDVIRELERERNSKIWCVIHQTPGAHICGPTMWSVYEGRNGIGTGDKIEILVHSGGGHPHIAYRTMKFFRRRFKEVNVIVPLSAKSAATLMAFAADHIYMGELADLGPIDIQLDDPVEHGQKSFSPLDEFKSLEFMREQAIEWMNFYAAAMSEYYGISIKEALKDSVPLVTALLRPVFEQIDPVEMGGYRRAIAMGEDYAKRMLKMTKNPRARDIVEQFVWGYAAHDFCIDREEAHGWGLPVEPLPHAQDQKLAEAILTYGGDVHGFAPALPTKPAKTGASRSVRQSRATATGNGRPRVNGSGRGGTPKRGGTTEAPSRPAAT